MLLFYAGFLAPLLICVVLLQQPSLFFAADSYLNFLPATVRLEVEEWGADLLLNITFAATKDFIPQHYFDMVRPDEPLPVSRCV